MKTYLITHCAPTLANIKTASLFTYEYKSQLELETHLGQLNTELNFKGVYVELLRVNRNRALIWVYRKSQMEEELKKETVQKLLGNYGYTQWEIRAVITYLKTRFINQDSFPHEIGIFLGYPLADVIGFIENAGQNSKCTGCWKVYCNECEAIRLFTLYKKCRVVYEKLFLRGKSIMQLTVAA